MLNHRTTQRRAGLHAVVLTVLLVLLLACAAGSLFLGSRLVPPADVWRGIVQPSAAPEDIAILVRDERVPRVAVGLAVGAALGLAGALTQGHTRNPLADPGLLGITSGAALLIVGAAFFLGVTDPAAQVWFAFAGAILGAAIVFLISALSGGATHPLTIILAGSALTAFLTAMTTMLVLSDRAALDVQRFWQAGSVAGRELSVLYGVLPYLLVGAAIALLSARSLTLLGLGDAAASSLGVRPTLVRWAGFVAIVLLTGAATALAGPIGFVGLIVPHAARLMGGPDYRWVVPASALLGAVLVIAADTVGRLVTPPSEVQAGIMLALVGAPVFIALVRRRAPVAP